MYSAGESLEQVYLAVRAVSHVFAVGPRPIQTAIGDPGAVPRSEKGFQRLRQRQAIPGLRFGEKEVVRLELLP